MQASGEPITDFNDLSADNAVGVGAPVFTKTGDNRRSSVRDWLVALESSTSRLTFQLDSLVTKVLTCTDDKGNIKAYGVEYAEGATVPVSPKFTGKQDLETITVTAKREIIVAAGAYQSPQLLMVGLLIIASTCIATDITTAFRYWRGCASQGARDRSRCRSSRRRSESSG